MGARRYKTFKPLSYTVCDLLRLIAQSTKGTRMALLSITQNKRPSDQQIDAALGMITKDAPIVIMLHGFKYDPDDDARDPQRHIFALNPAQGAKRPASWPRRLRLQGNKGLAIGFGWHACGTIWQAHHQASQAGHDLAQLISRLQAKDINRNIHIVAHSLGARVAVQALQYLAPNTIGRVILIAAALFEKELQDGLHCAAGRQAEFINVRSRANTAFDLMLRMAFPLWGRTVGSGRVTAANLLDVAIDSSHTADVLKRLCFGSTKAGATICHWSGYLRQDACNLYQSLLHQPEQTPLRYLQSLLQPPGRESMAKTRDTLSFLPRMPF